MSTVTEYINNEYKDYSKYVLYSRAIPHLIDGMKPSQRKILYTAIKTAKKKIKTASLSGNTISQGNYHHGDASLNEAIIKMVQPFANNAPLLDGEGSFGSRLVPEAAAPRYTYVKLGKNFEKYFIDTEVAEQSVDPEDPEPAFYLPVIPWVLVNGVKGIAVGFATDILPRHPKSLQKMCVDYANGKSIDKKIVKPHFPHFSGNIARDENGTWYCEGKFDNPTKTKMNITEVPIGYTRETYVQVLDKLEQDGKIVSYTDKCNKSGFKFTIQLRRATTLSEAQLIRMFKLKKNLKENLTVIDQNGQLQVYKNVNEIIKDFVDYRISKYKDRYDLLIANGQVRLDLLRAKIEFIKMVLDSTLKFKGKTKAKIRTMLSKYFDKETIEILIKMPIYSLCKDELDKVVAEGKELTKQIRKWRKVDMTEQYIQEVGSL
jgi:DNA topoisomerase-2